MVASGESGHSLPQDTGWSWVVCFATFIIVLVVGLGIQALAILFLELVEEFQTSLTVTSLTLTMFVLLVSISSLVSTSILVPRFDERRVIVVSGFVFASCSVAFSVAPNIGIFIAVAALQGLSLGLIGVPALSLLSFYFLKRRSLALALSNSGICVAGIIAPPIIREIIGQYGLRGTFLILAGIEFHLVAAGLLMRPVSSYRHIPRTETTLTVIDESETVLFQETSESQENDIKTCNKNCRQFAQKELYFLPDTTIESQPDGARIRLRSINDDIIREERFCSDEEDHKTRTLADQREKLDTETKPCEGSADSGEVGELLCGQQSSGDHQLSGKNVIHGHAQHRRHRGSVLSTASSLGAVLFDMDTLSEEKEPPRRNSKNCFCELLGRIFDFSMLRHWALRLLLVSAIPSANTLYLQQYLPTIGQVQGATKSQTTILLTILGSVDLASRLTLGLVADSKLLRPTQIVAISQICLGIVCQFITLFRTFQSLISMMVLMGLFVGTTQSLMAPMTIEVVGMDHMARCLSIYSMVTTVSSAAHGPLLSALMEATGSFTAVMYYVGAAIFVGGVILLFSRLVIRMNSKPEQENSQCESEVGSRKCLMYHKNSSVI